MSTMERFLKGIRLFGLLGIIQIALSPLRKAYDIARFAGQRRWGPSLWLATWHELQGHPAAPAAPSAYTQPGRVRNHTLSGQTVSVVCENATIHVTVLAADLMRVELQRAGESIDTLSYAIARTDDAWPPVPFDMDDAESALTIRTGRLVSRIDKASSRISFLDPQRGDAVITAETTGMAWHEATVACSHSLSDGHVYGLGEKAFGLDRRGHTYEMWNSDPNGAYVQGHDPLYISIPFYIALHDQIAYGVFFDNTHRARIDAASRPGIVPGNQSMQGVTFQATGGPLRYYFFYGPLVATILDRYTELTGRLRMPPLWALGYHQSRWSYTPDKRVRDLAHEFRSRRIPCEAIHLDIHHMDGYRCFTWHPQHFPNPVGLIQALHAQGFKVIPLIDCGIKSDLSYRVCADGLAQNVFCAFPNGQPYHGPVWPGDCYFPDFTSPRVRAWWGQQHKPLLEVGIDGVWNDMNEPTVFGPVTGTLPDMVQHDWEGRGATHAQAHNIYGMQMARASAEGLEALRPGQRTFVITRSAWAGLQRYAMNWMGDNISTWEHLHLTMPMIANLGLSGLAFTGPDTGGFAGNCAPELLTRWLQFGAFTPFLRNHAALGTANQEPWVHGEPFESINRRYIELRYHLLPYLYTAFWQCAQMGLPMVRPLFLQWQDDPRTATIEDEFMFGDALLVAPVDKPAATQREVYLPSGAWYDWWTGRRYEGAQTVTVEAPLGRLPLFARAGSVVPAWPVMQHSGERPVDVLTLHIFPGDGQSVLYEDDGRSLAYQQGMFRVTRFDVQSSQDNLAVERTTEGPFTPDYSQVELVLHGMGRDAVRAAEADGQAIANWVFEEEAHVVRCRAPLAKSYVVQTWLDRQHLVGLSIPGCPGGCRYDDCR